MRKWAGFYINSDWLDAIALFLPRCMQIELNFRFAYQCVYVSCILSMGTAKRKSRIDFTSDLPSTYPVVIELDSLYQNVGGKSIVDFTDDSTRFFAVHYTQVKIVPQVKIAPCIYRYTCICILSRMIAY